MRDLPGRFGGPGLCCQAISFVLLSAQRALSRCRRSGTEESDCGNLGLLMIEQIAVTIHLQRQ